MGRTILLALLLLLFLFFLDKVKKSMEIVNNGPDVKNECGEAGSADE